MAKRACSSTASFAVRSGCGRCQSRHFGHSARLRCDRLVHQRRFSGRMPHPAERGPAKACTGATSTGHDGDRGAPRHHGERSASRCAHRYSGLLREGAERNSLVVRTATDQRDGREEPTLGLEGSRRRHGGHLALDFPLQINLAKLGPALAAGCTDADLASTVAGGVGVCYRAGQGQGLRDRDADAKSG